MAVRISEARLESDTSRKVSANAYQAEGHAIALCPDLRCLCKLRYVPAGNRQITGKDGVGKQVDIDPYFGLPSRWKKEGGGHTDIEFSRVWIPSRVSKPSGTTVTKADTNSNLIQTPMDIRGVI